MKLLSIFTSAAAAAGLLVGRVSVMPGLERKVAGNAGFSLAERDTFNEPHGHGTCSTAPMCTAEAIMDGTKSLLTYVCPPRSTPTKERSTISVTVTEYTTVTPTVSLSAKPVVSAMVSSVLTVPVVHPSYSIESSSEHITTTVTVHSTIHTTVRLTSKLVSTNLTAIAPSGSSLLNFTMHGPPGTIAVTSATSDTSAATSKMPANSSKVLFIKTETDGVVVSSTAASEASSVKPSLLSLENFDSLPHLSIPALPTANSTASRTRVVEVTVTISPSPVLSNSRTSSTTFPTIFINGTEGIFPSHPCNKSTAWSTSGSIHASAYFWPRSVLPRHDGPHGHGPSSSWNSTTEMAPQPTVDHHYQEHHHEHDHKHMHGAGTEALLTTTVSINSTINATATITSTRSHEHNPSYHTRTYATTTKYSKEVTDGVTATTITSAMSTGGANHLGRKAAALAVGFNIFYVLQ